MRSVAHVEREQNAKLWIALRKLMHALIFSVASRAGAGIERVSILVARMAASFCHADDLFAFSYFYRARPSGAGPLFADTDALLFFLRAMCRQKFRRVKIAAGRLSINLSR